MHHGYHGTKTENAKGECKGTIFQNEHFTHMAHQNKLSHEIPSSTGNSRLVTACSKVSLLQLEKKKEKKSPLVGRTVCQVATFLFTSPSLFFLKTSESWFVPTFRPRFDREIIWLVGYMCQNQAFFFCKRDPIEMEFEFWVRRRKFELRMMKHLKCDFLWKARDIPVIACTKQATNSSCLTIEPPIVCENPECHIDSERTVAIYVAVTEATWA